MKTTEKKRILFDSWRSLSYNIDDLKYIVQNPVVNLTKEDIERWTENFNNLKEELDKLGGETKKFVHSHYQENNEQEQPQREEKVPSFF